MIYAVRQRGIADNLTISYLKKVIDVSFSCFCPVIDSEFRHNIVKVVCAFTATLSVMTKFVTTNRTDAWKTDGTLLDLSIFHNVVKFLPSFVLNGFDFTFRAMTIKPNWGDKTLMKPFGDNSFGEKTMLNYATFSPQKAPINITGSTVISPTRQLF